MTLDAFLRLGRVSNLPTVWTNALAGATLAGGAAGLDLALAALSLTLAYTGGMWLNDAFDAEIDARERPGRPIPAGLVARGTVFAGGYAMLAASVALAALIGLGAALAAALLACAVVLYDWVHKRTPLAPLIMGATRFLAYGVGAMAAGGPTPLALLGAAGLFAHVVGLTYAAKQEAHDRIGAAWPLAVLAVPAAIALWGAFDHPRGALIALAYAGVALWAVRLLFRRGKGDVPKAVVTMIAAIALYDAALLAEAEAPGLALLAIAAFVLTLRLQRIAPGT